MILAVMPNPSVPKDLVAEAFLVFLAAILEVEF